MENHNNEINFDEDDVLNFIKNKKKEIKTDNTNCNEEYIIGIDLGTTNCCVAIWRNNNLEIIPDEKGNKTIPSYIAYTNINRYIGLDAKNQSVLNSNNVYYEVKRLIGRKYSDNNVQNEKRLLSYKIIPDDNDNIRLHSTLGYNEEHKTFSPEEVVSNLLMKIKHMASIYLKTQITKAVITIPARFTDAQRQATYDASVIAGLDCVRMIHEPTAAAMAYGLINREIEENKVINIIVYDFGGGTLDVSLVEISKSNNGDNVFAVLGSAGNTHLGGADFDNKIVGFSLNKFKKINSVKNLDNLSSLSLQKLKQSCENAKKILSTKAKTYIAVKEFYDEKDLFFPITRDDFEIICSDLFLLALKPIDDVLEATNLTVDDCEEIILVGGMTRMPSIQNLIKMKFKKQPNNSLNPDEAIAAGAAIQGAILSGNDNPFSESVTLLDITPLSLGVETVGGIMDILIDRGTFIPYNITKLYTTDSDYDISVLIKIFEGERRLTIDNIFVGEFEMTGIESAPRGIPKIEVNFNIDNNGIVTVSAEDQKSKEKKSIIVNSNKGRLTKQEISRLIEEAKELELRDEIEKRKKLMHYECDDICCNILNNIKNKNFKLSDHNQVLITKDIESVINWLKEKKYYDRTDDEIEQILENLKRKYGQLVVRGCLENEDNKVNELNRNDTNATSIYGNEDDDNDNIADENRIIDKIESDNQGLSGLSDPEISELKNLRKSLFDLCYSIFDIICNEGFVIQKEHKNELKDYIDDTLLWLHVHEKPTQIEYKQKLDEVNEVCDKIMKIYEENKSTIFNENILIKETTKKTELENMCISLDILIKEKKNYIKIRICIKSKQYVKFYIKYNIH